MSVVLILFLSGSPPRADPSIASTVHPTMEDCEPAGRAVQRYRHGRGVFWACVTRAPR